MSDQLHTAIGAAGEAEPLAALRILHGARAEIERAEAEQVRRARAQQYSWLAIADALGVSRQAAHKKYGRR